jgi:hypothetical protein
MNASELAPTLHRLAELLAVVRRMAGDARTEAAKLPPSMFNFGAVQTLHDVADGCACPDAVEKLETIAKQLSTATTTSRSLAAPVTAPAIVETMAKSGSIQIALGGETEPNIIPKLVARPPRRRDAKEPSPPARAERSIMQATPNIARRKCIDPNCTWIGSLPTNAKCPTCGKSTIKVR